MGQADSEDKRLSAVLTMRDVTVSMDGAKAVLCALMEGLRTPDGDSVVAIPYSGETLLNTLSIVEELVDRAQTEVETIFANSRTKQ